MKYGIPTNTSGVYMITCKATNKSYIGSSINISARFSNHFYRDSRRYTHREFYQDVVKYGIEGFDWKVLEECPRDNLIGREQYWYDKLKPAYNDIRPCEQPFLNPLVRRRAVENSNTPEKVQERKARYLTPEYQELFRHVHVEKMRPIIMTDLEGNILKEFISMQEGSRWLDENTSYKGKNKTSKIKAVADGERRMAYGFKFHYKHTIGSVETIQ